MLEALRSPLRHARNVLLDLRYGAVLGGSRASSQVRPRGAYSSFNSDYGLLDQMFEARIAPDECLVDVGSGRGRVINHWLRRGHRGPIYGLEIDPALAAATACRLARWPNVTILAGDAADTLPARATLLFMFNPFDGECMRRLRGAIAHRIAAVDRLRIVYYAPTCLEVWREGGEWDVELRDLDLRGIERFAERHRRYAVITPRRIPTSAPSAR